MFILELNIVYNFISIVISPLLERILPSFARNYAQIPQNLGFKFQNWSLIWEYVKNKAAVVTIVKSKVHLNTKLNNNAGKRPIK